MNLTVSPALTPQTPPTSRQHTVSDNAFTYAPARDSVQFSGKSGKKEQLANTPENREALATKLTTSFPFDKYVDFLDAQAVKDGEPAGSVREQYTEDRIDGLKTALIDFFRDGEDYSIKDIQDALDSIKAMKAGSLDKTFNWLRAIERDMGY